MKTYKFLLMGLVTASIFTGCKDDDFLKEDPKTIYTVENAFEKSSQVDATITRSYYTIGKLHGWDNFFLDLFQTNYGYRRSCMLGGQGADVIGGDGQLNHELGTLDDFKTLTTDYSDFNDLWNDLYELAAQANLAMHGAELVTWDSEDDKNYDLAQARFFRGWSYLRLGECYGGVPIVSEYSEELKFDYGRSSRAETYQFAIDDFEYAIKYLPDFPKQDGRISKYAVMHYLTEAYIALGTETGDKSDFKKAEEYGLQVIAKHPMMTDRFGVRSNPQDTDPANGSGIDPTDPSKKVANYKADGNVYYDLFQLGNYDYSCGNTEALFVAQQPTYENYSVSGGLTYPLGITCYAACNGQSWSEAYAAKNPKSAGPWKGSKFDGGEKCAYLGGSSWGLVGTTDYADDVVWAGKFADDMRNEDVCRDYPVVTDPNSPYIGVTVTPEMLKDPAACQRHSCKISMADGWGWTAHHMSWGTYSMQYGRDWYMARSAETYLLLAEAYLRDGDETNALKYLNAVRERAHAKYLYTSLTLRDILDERARELVWEEHRWPTLLRWDSSTGNNDDMKYQLEHYTMLANDEGYDGNGAPKWTLFPIPQTVINLNKEAELTQNPGW